MAVNPFQALEGGLGWGRDGGPFGLPDVERFPGWEPGGFAVRLDGGPVASFGFCLEENPECFGWVPALGFSLDPPSWLGR